MFSSSKKSLSFKTVDSSQKLWSRGLFFSFKEKTIHFNLRNFRSRIHTSQTSSLCQGRGSPFSLKEGKPSLEFGKRKWSQSTTEKENAREPSHQNHISIFSNKKKGKSHRGIFNIVSCNLFGFCFRQVHWGTIKFGQRTDNPQKSEWPKWKKKNTTRTRKRLTFYQSAQIQTICKKTSSQNNLSYRQLITNHLRHGSTASQKSISTIPRPTCLQNSIDTLTPYCKDIHSPLRQFSHCTGSTGWKSSPPDLARLKGLDRSPIVLSLIGIAWLDWFFEKQFQTIQKGLQNTKSTYCIRTHSTLHCPHDAALNQSQKCNSKLLRNNCCLDYYNQIQDHNSCFHLHLNFFFNTFWIAMRESFFFLQKNI